MNIIKPILTLALLVLLSTCFTNCEEFKNLPPAEIAVNDPSLLGEYYTEDAQGIRSDFIIKRVEGNLFPYVLTSLKDNTKEKPLSLQLYKCGENLIAVMPYPNAESPQRSIFGVSISKTQIVMKNLDPSFFKKNPDALPNTSVKEEKGYVSSYKIVSTASADQLKHFFSLHDNNSKVFINNSSNKPIVFNKISK